MNILDIFRSNATATPAPVTSTPTGQTQTPTAVNPDVVAVQGTQASPIVNNQNQASPLDEFTKLLQDAPIDPNAAPTGPQPPKLNLDVAKLQETVKGMDFGVQVTPEIMAKIQQGDLASLQGLLNQVGQAAFLRSAVSNSSVTEQLVNGSINYLQHSMPGAVKTEGILAEIQKNPTLNHEAVNGFAQQLAMQIAKNSPQSSAQEVAEKTMSYLQLIGNGGKPVQSPQTNPNVPTNAATDWNSFFQTT